jgi:hypothetical protein
MSGNLQLGLDLLQHLGGLLEVGVESGGLAIVGDGAVLVAGLETRIAAIVIGRRVFGIDLDRQVVIGDGAVVVLATGSENIPVTWRRSAVSLAALSVAGEASDSGVSALAPARKAAIASSSLRRSPTNPTPRSFKSSAVKLGRTLSSILFSRKAAS